MRLVLCDDNRIWCEALAAVLQARGHRVLAIATSAADSVRTVTAHRPDTCLLDLRFPDGSGLDVAHAIRRRQPDTKILLLSCLSDRATIAEAGKIGVVGFVRKDLRADVLIAALDRIDAGGTAFSPGNVVRESRLSALTPREAQVLRRIVAGQGTGQMAGEMNLAASTLRSYIRSILAKLGAHSRLEAAAIASKEAGVLISAAGSANPVAADRHVSMRVRNT